MLILLSILGVPLRVHLCSLLHRAPPKWMIMSLGLKELLLLTLPINSNEVLQNYSFWLMPIQEPGEASQHLKWHKKQTGFSLECVINSSYVREASFAISHLIAKQLKPFSTSDLFLKSCWKLFHFYFKILKQRQNL